MCICIALAPSDHFSYIFSRMGIPGMPASVPPASSSGTNSSTDTTSSTTTASTTASTTTTNSTTTPPQNNEAMNNFMSQMLNLMGSGGGGLPNLGGLGGNVSSFIFILSNTIYNIVDNSQTSPCM